MCTPGSSSASQAACFSAFNMRGLLGFLRPHQSRPVMNPKNGGSLHVADFLTVFLGSALLPFLLNSIALYLHPGTGLQSLRYCQLQLPEELS